MWKGHKHAYDSSRICCGRESQKKAVLVSLDEWQQLMEAIEELDDIRAYDQAKTKPDGLVPFAEAVREIKAKRCSTRFSFASRHRKTLRVSPLPSKIVSSMPFVNYPAIRDRRV